MPSRKADGWGTRRETRRPARSPTPRLAPCGCRCLSVRCAPVTSRSCAASRTRLASLRLRSSSAFGGRPMGGPTVELPDVGRTMVCWFGGAGGRLGVASGHRALLARGARAAAGLADAPGVDLRAVHSLVPCGPHGPAGADDAAVVCRRCGRKAFGLQRWRRLLGRPFSAGWHIRFEGHELVPIPGGSGCARCGAHVAPARLAGAMRNRAGEVAFFAGASRLREWASWVASPPLTPPGCAPRGCLRHWCASRASLQGPCRVRDLLHLGLYSAAVARSPSYVHDWLRQQGVQAEPILP